MPEIAVKQCHPLKSICLLLNGVEHHLNRREFSSPTLTKELLPDNVRIVFKSAADDIAREDALPIVAHQVSGLQITPYFAYHNFIPTQGEAITAELAGGVNFTVSTTNEALTAELATEIGVYCMTIYRSLRSEDLLIQQITVSPVQRSQGGYYEATVQLTASLGKPVWKNEANESILREIGMRLTFN